MGAFVVGDPRVGINTSTRRSIGQMDLTNPQMKRVVDACRQLGHQTESPYALEDCAAPICLPKKKIAFFIRIAIDYSVFGREYAKWKAHGWEMLRISHRQLSQMTDEQLLKNLSEALKEVGKQK